VWQSYPITGLDKSVGLQEVEAHRISRQSAHEGGKVVSPTHRPPLPPGRTPVLISGSESTTGPKCGRKDKVNEKSRWPIGNRTRDLPACSALPQPITPPRTPELVRSWEKSVAHYRIGTPDRPACSVVSVVSPPSVCSFPSENKQQTLPSCGWRRDAAIMRGCQWRNETLSGRRGTYKWRRAPA
jgi:hypothetical protein